MPTLLWAGVIDDIFKEKRREGRGEEGREEGRKGGKYRCKLVRLGLMSEQVQLLLLTFLLSRYPAGTKQSTVLTGTERNQIIDY